jgi:hypothetical protein
VSGEVTINCGAAKVAMLPYAGRPWSQAMVTAVWKGMYNMEPAPLVPKTLLGWYSVASRGPRMFALTPKGKDGSLRGATKEEAKFLNFWGQAVTDPCRKQSGISKIAGGILKIAAVFIPAFSYFQVAQSAVNAVQEPQRQKELVKLGTELLTAAANAQPIPMNPAPITQLPAPQPFAPMNPAPLVQMQPRTPAAPKRSAYTASDYAIAGAAGLVLYLLIQRIRTR